MPTPYTGTPTNVQSPAAAPTPESAPLLNVPVDADPPNASTFIQAFKVLADYVAWLFKPIAKLSDWTKPIIRWRAANGHTRHYVDHLGLPAGRLIQWDECWDASASEAVTGALASVGLFGSPPVAYSATFLSNLNTAASQLIAGGTTAVTLADVKIYLDAAGVSLQAAAAAYSAGALGGRWFLKGQQTAGTGYALTITYGTKRLRALSIECGDNAGTDYTMVWRYGACQWNDDLVFTLEWDLQVAAANIPHREVLVGISEIEHIPGTIGTATNYAVFELGQAGNFFCSNGGSGGHDSVDSGVAAAPGTWMRFRIEFHGANVADNGVRAIRYYINGALVATATGAHLPDATADSAFNYTIWNGGGGASGYVAPPGPTIIGPVRFRGTTYGADVV